jgi:phosphoglycolate phosphatase-like HAD superfamily hydrolase
MIQTHEEAMTLPLAIFDLDGTLTATNEVDSSCFVEAIRAEFGFTPNADWGSYEHCTDEGIVIEAATAHLDAAPSVQDLERLKRRFAHLLAEAAVATPHLFALIPGARELLRHLSGTGWAVAIATGAWRVSAELKLAAAGLAEGIPLFCSDGTPSREAILEAAMGPAPAARVVAVGDGVWDVRAAARLGLPFVGVGEGPRATNLRAAGATVVIPDFRDLPAAVRCLELAGPPVLPS